MKLVGDLNAPLMRMDGDHKLMLRGYWSEFVKVPSGPDKRAGITSAAPKDEPKWLNTLRTIGFSPAPSQHTSLLSAVPSRS